MSGEARLERLFARTHAGIKPGLECMEALLAALDHPERSMLHVHVAGTNGKGSTCALIESIARHWGLRCGLYTSPHLVRVTERIRVAGEEVSPELLELALDAVEAVEDSLPQLPTFFEVLTAAAFWCFRAAGVQIAVLETGMGGRLDATNVVVPLVSVITRIDMDHMAYLGDTLAKIAFEKAGILKAGRPAVFLPQAEEAMAVLQSRAEALGCPWRCSGEVVSLSRTRGSLEGQTVLLETYTESYGTLRLPLLGDFQLQALAGAVTAMEEVAAALGQTLPREAVREGVAAVRWPARMQVLSQDPLTVLDVAHNPAGAAALARTLRSLLGPKARGCFVIAQMQDKEVDGFLQALAPLMARALCVPLATPRAMAAETLAAKAGALGIGAEVCTFEAARRLVQEDFGSDFVCIAGSVYLAGAWLGENPDPGEGFPLQA